MERRHFISLGASAFGAGLAVGVLPRLAFSEEKKDPNKVGVLEVSPAEDLMREHGALNRILLIYDEILRRFKINEEFDPALLKNSAQIIRNFIENYHEKLEEEYIFPRLKKAGKLVELVDTLVAQHQVGRKLTDIIVDLSNQASIKNPTEVRQLEEALLKFIHMYRPHEAREDTILFPAFKSLLSQKEYDKLGDQFEDKEHELFGKEGFEGILIKIADIEKSLAIYELAKFTPQL